MRLPLPVANLARRLWEGTLRAGDINAFLDVEPSGKASVPLVDGTAACGFPSPADDYLDRPLGGLSGMLTRWWFTERTSVPSCPSKRNLLA